MKFSFFMAGLYLASQVTLTTPTLKAATQNEKTNKSAGGSQTPKTVSSPEQQLTRTSTRMLQEVNLARQAIAKKQTQTALQHLNQALADQSRVASLAKAKNLPTVIPLYSEFDESSVLGPLAAKKKGQTGSSSSSTVGVEKTSGDYTFIGIDLDKAKQRLDAAKTALDNKNSQAADDSLAAIGDELVVETVGNDLPLLTARENLALAEDAVKKAHYSEAATALKDATTALDKYSNQSSAQHAQDAKTLGQTINSYSQNIAQTHAGAASKIDGWWHQVNNWFTKSNAPS